MAGLLDAAGSSQPAEGPGSFARLFARLGGAQGDRVEVEIDVRAGGGRADDAFVRQHTWRLMDGIALPPEGFEAWNGLLEGLAVLHGPPPVLRVDVLERLDLGDPFFEWRIRRR